MNATNQKLKFSQPDDGSWLIDIKTDAGELIGTCTDIDQARLWVAAPGLLEAAEHAVSKLTGTPAERYATDVLNKLHEALALARKEG